jgi:hypothetical protein
MTMSTKAHGTFLSAVVSGTHNMHVAIETAKTQSSMWHRSLIERIDTVA